MEKRRIGRSALLVSDLCMGTMTFGSRNSEAEAFAIMDRAFDAGINFYDTAEVYPVPPDIKWVNRTEEIVGKWLKTKNRDSIILATKVAGSAPGWFTPPIRGQNTGLDRHHLTKAIEGSLRRLGTDYIDLYQTHWPDHAFGYEETLDVLTEFRNKGLVRVIGSSNETPWGTMKAQAVAESRNSIRYDSIQNNFSILNRRFEDALSDICTREQISCLPYSPLAGGVCSGKYNKGQRPLNARFSEYLQNGAERQKIMATRFVNEKSLATVTELQSLAKNAGLGLVPMCLAWSKQHNFVASTIFGATSLDQLEESLQARDLILSEDILSEINTITQRYPYPLG